jgi:hypothetical protein
MLKVAHSASSSFLVTASASGEFFVFDTTFDTKPVFHLRIFASIDFVSIGGVVTKAYASPAYGALPS